MRADSATKSRGVRRNVIVAMVIGVALGMVSLLPLLAGPAASGEREILLVARGMAFYVDGDDKANPTLRFKPGERVRVVLRNEEPGITHDFAIADWKVEIPPMDDGSRSVVFRVPGSRGSHSYVCNPHSTMMHGVVEVE